MTGPAPETLTAYACPPLAADPLTPEEFARWWEATGEHELRQILLWRWDPLGVADYFPNTADEYDSYAPQLVQVLRTGGGPEAVVAHLAAAERDLMGGAFTTGERLAYLGSLVHGWYENSQASWADHGPVRR